MKILLISILFIIAFSFTANAQKVEVEQSFIDDCTKAFNEVVTLRDALEKFKAERAKNEQERQSAEILIKGLNDLLSIKDKTISQYEQLVKFQQQIIEFQQQIITKLQEMLKKPKSSFQKILGTIQKIAVFVGGILIGRGLSF